MSESYGLFYKNRPDFDELLYTISWATHRRDPDAPLFVRMGMVGDWRNCFTAEQSAPLDEKITQRTAGSGLFIGPP